MSANLARLTLISPELKQPANADANDEKESVEDVAKTILARARTTKAEALIVKCWIQAPVPRKALIEKQISRLTENNVDASKTVQSHVWAAVQEVLNGK